MVVKRSGKEWWMSLSIRYKVGILVGSIMVMITAVCLFSLGSVYVHMRDFNEILGDSYQVSHSLVCFEAENAAFIACSQSMNDESLAQYQQARQQTKEAISQLRLDYRETGLQRYLIAQAVQTSYSYYSSECNRLLTFTVRDTIYANQYYGTLDIAGYISRYLQELIMETLDEGNDRYSRKMQTLQILPVITISLSAIILALATLLGTVTMRNIIRPVLQLADSAKKIAENQLDTPDVQVNNQDEIGRLVEMFNRMKGSMREYIATLQEVNQMEGRLHQEELRKVEMEQQLKAMQLSMLQSQINPHFLFNTLNTIRSTSKIEEAHHTEELIQRLANLFRYNLQTSDAIVPLEREMNIIQDYIYIQQRRFGSRLNFVADNRTDEKAVLVPVFTLQPLVENAIIHGISPKEEGGSVRVRIRQKGEFVLITVTDTGQGISREKLHLLLDQTIKQQGHLSHIGMGNVRSRLEMLFAGSHFKVYSRVGLGTSIRLGLPAQKEETLHV